MYSFTEISALQILLERSTMLVKLITLWEKMVKKTYQNYFFREHVR